jgi:transaldolase
MPDPTIEAFNDHGVVSRTVDAGLDEARDVLAQLAAAGVSLDDVTRQLELDGVKSFSASFDSLLGTIQEKLDRMGERGAA